MLKGCTIIEDVASVACCINTQLRTSNHVEYTRCNIVMLMAATALLLLSFSTCIVCGFDSYAVLFKCPQRKSPPPLRRGKKFSNQIQSNPPTIQELKDISSHAVAAIKIIMLHRVYLNMVTARMLTNCSNSLRNMHTNNRENITRTHAKRKVGYFFVAHSVFEGGLNSGKDDVLCSTIHFIVAGINRLHEVHDAHSFRRTQPGVCVCVSNCVSFRNVNIGRSRPVMGFYVK